ncbi:MAG: hypothetical protein P4L46_19840 [Fimbriimonas sp.]|nr:hypothetical protein [Fimbriimonas sp.]
MTSIQPILALLLAALCIVLSEVPEGQKRFAVPNFRSVAALVFLLVLGGYATIRFGQVDDQRAVIASLVAGGTVAIAAVAISGLAIGGSLALAIAGSCVAHLVRANSFQEVGLAYAFAVGIGAIVFGELRGPTAAAIVGGIVAMTDYLGKDSEGPTSRALVGVAMGIGLSVAGVLFLGARKLLPKPMAKVEPPVIAVLAATAGYLVSRLSIGPNLWLVIGMPALAALVTNWLLPKDVPATPLRTGLAAATWLALATIGFSVLRGFGIAATVLEGSFILLLLGNDRAILAMGPTIGLLMYRVLRDASPDTSRALDIGQHYGVTGIVVGGMIPMMFFDWFIERRPAKPATRAVGSILWGFVLICLPALSIVVLGSKGASGVVVGLGLGAFLVTTRPASSALPLAVAIAAGATNSVAVDWIGETIDFTRQAKLHAFGIWTIAMILAAIGIVAVSRRDRAEEAL